MDELEQLVKDNKPLPRFPLAGTLRAKASAEASAPWKSTNVVGILPGSDPKLKDEYVIMSAHLDHVGVGSAVNGDSIYNGAMDDASGVATVIEIARMLKESGAKPKRSILFLAVRRPKRRACWGRGTSRRVPRCPSRRSLPTSTWICSCRCIR